MSEIGKLLSEAVASNFWGLSCPGHCGSPAAFTLGLSFLAGLSSGIALSLLVVLFLAFGLAGHLPSAPPDWLLLGLGLDLKLLPIG